MALPDPNPFREVYADAVRTSLNVAADLQAAGENLLYALEVDAEAKDILYMYLVTRDPDYQDHQDAIDLAFKDAEGAAKNLHNKQVWYRVQENLLHYAQKDETRKRAAYDHGSMAEQALLDSEIALYKETLTLPQTREEANSEKATRVKAARDEEAKFAREAEARGKAAHEDAALAKAREENLRARYEHAKEIHVSFKLPAKTRRKPSVEYSRPVKKPAGQDNGIGHTAWTTSPTKWFRKVDRAFADYTAMKTFPPPPAKACGEIGCEANKAYRALEACECNLRHTFEGMDAHSLKQARHRFHPDNFSLCVEGTKDDIKKMATEVFMVIDRLYREKK